ncbi:MAG: energy transducer TonB [Bacteroidales bacterium]|jgi:protein TonB|nr:energy transducer TonB [Bacteroidales bacterium]
MNAKKTTSADLDGNRRTFLCLGLVTAIGFSLAAFEHTTQGTGAIVTMGTVVSGPEDELWIPVTPPPQQEMPPPSAVSILNIVDDVFDGPDDAMRIDGQELDAPIMIVPVRSPITELPTDDMPLVVAEEMPEFPGGAAALNHFLAATVKYPSVARDNGAFGKVIIKFVVETDGSITDAQVYRSIDPLLDAEALRVVKQMSRWKPGTQRGKPVRVYFTVPVNFVLKTM